ncbi:MAG: Flp pilus assembly complex ATPase component TadA [Euryarchaeota archaeon]|jgi:ATPase|nr:MAG: putative ATPase [uncultured Candidatus Poseidoniales archaeon]MBT3451867.1 Flp pilus assembly complex ATPase component TadA [Euryarchaeota archaeon]MDA8550396.1 ATPase, T2SS/T4P/T4SS family [Candidatus Poseidoniales archaeon]MDB0004673.1 ATPase, T2SS/T4P/T4SS family [Candidatus Poseidoniaceae archaeon]MBT5618854.1 Flp pilus assembly complex ATPase component TadA [Euryarchaeota archaeon]
MAKYGDHPALPQRLEDLLMEDVHTVFIKADCPPRVKRGSIGQLRLVDVEGADDGKWDTLRMESLQEELVGLIDEHRHRSDCFLEIDRKGCQVIQLGDLRISCAWPPFADAREITIVRPVAKLSLGDYELDQRLIDRLADHHRGVFICGRPGSGKTTLAQAIAEYLDTDVGAMVKTMEAPRDLQLADRITQYAPLEGDLEKTAEIIFLVRPDFVIFDEVRRARDFEIFADVRLAGVGLLGVTHANSALEAIQRLIGKVELGLVSQVLDTIIHVEAGQIEQVMELRMTVKPPTGMQEELARPVIEVVEFPSGKITHEMFAFGSEIAVVPVEGRKQGALSPMKTLARDQLVHIIQQWVGVQCQVQFKGESSATIYAPQNMISTLIGKGGENVRQLQDELGGMQLNIESFDEMPESMGAPSNPHWRDVSDRRSRGGRAWEHNARGTKPRKNKGKNNRK